MDFRHGGLVVLGGGGLTGLGFGAGLDDVDAVQFGVVRSVLLPLGDPDLGLLPRSVWKYLIATAPPLTLFGLAGVASWRLVRRERPDVIHAHWVLPQGFVAMVVGKLFRVPVVVTAHRTDL